MVGRALLVREVGRIKHPPGVRPADSCAGLRGLRRRNATLKFRRRASFYSGNRVCRREKERCIYCALGPRVIGAREEVVLSIASGR